MFADGKKTLDLLLDCWFVSAVLLYCHVTGWLPTSWDLHKIRFLRECDTSSVWET
ncbi:hypothetical protein BDZ45DRAFT_125410 [Acephala macrosclerotiorum]|nr:hypothetical protein BDZ45DRAFT_125410 [Acephala macrosclerotiorum]